MLNESGVEGIFCRILRFPVITVVVLLAASASARSQSSFFVLDTLKSEYLLNDYLRVWEDSTKKETFETVSTTLPDSLFQPYNEENPLPRRLGIYWGKILLVNDLREPGLVKDWLLWTGEGSYIDVYVSGTDGRLREHLKTGELVPAREKKLATGNRVERVPFSLAVNDTAAVFIRLQLVDYHWPRFNLRLTQTDYMDTPEALGRTRTDWLFLGFLAAIMVFSLLLFLTTRDRAFLFHGLFLFSAIVFMLDIFGVMPDLPLLRDHPKWANYLNYLALTCWDIFLLQFFRSYMQLEVALPRWDKILKLLIRLRIGFFLAIFTFFAVTFNEVQTDRLTILYLAVQYLAVIVFLVALGRIRDPKANFLIVATLFFIIGLGVNAYLVANGIPIDRLFSEGAMVGEVLMFSIGLAYRMQQLQEEEKTAHRLRDLDELKNHLYSNITHEFRTPLTVINGMVGQLMKKPAGNPDRPLQMIRQNSDHLLGLVNRLLDLAKIESGRLQMQSTRGDLVAYLRQLVEFYQPLAAKKTIALRFLTPHSKLETDFDSEIIRQIFSNLLSNAVKFTPENGSITVSIEKKETAGGEQVVVAISDSGIGIPEADLPYVFDRFYQAKNAARAYGLGTGIGLALTRELVTLAAGQIEVKSSEGHGSVFTVTLPLQRLAETANAAPPALPVLQEEDWQPEIPAEYKIPATSNAGSQKDLVLVIEDNPHIVEYLRSLLEDHFEVEAAFNGRDGIDLALETIPDLVVSDVIMPEMDGFDVLETLKKDTRTSHIPIVLLTALASVKDRIAGLERGADAYLGKPFEGRELLAILNNLLEQRSRLQAFFKKGEGELPDASEAPLPPEDAFMTEAKNVLAANLGNEDFGILQLQRSLAVSRSQLHRKLKALTGMSTTEFINHMRLQKARTLLADVQLNISEIAFDTGFKDPNYFTRLFVKFYGKTPTDYRYELANATLKATDSNAATKHEKH